VTDEDFDLIDSLYFISSFDAIKAELRWQEAVLKERLHQLIIKGWVKCLEIGSDIEIEDINNFDLHYKNYNYLVTKEGLFAHNSR
jgi:hypothetical protein